MDGGWYERKSITMNQFEINLEHQKDMNRTTWQKLIESGFSLSEEVSLDFTFITRKSGNAEKLKKLLEVETNYHVEIVKTDSEWEVVGHTKNQHISLEILDQWVEWMVAAGEENGGCEFDGWGAQVP